MLAWSKAVFSKARLKLLPLTLSKALGGKLVIDEQLLQARKKLDPLDMSSGGKLVIDEHLNHETPKLDPLDVSISGNSVISDRPSQKLVKSLTAP
jgi:hypothetical protein